MSLHDFFEGVFPCEVKLFVYHIVYDLKLITLFEINRRIRCTDFGSEFSRPSSLLESRIKSDDSALGQRSSKMLTLFYFLPLLIADKLVLLRYRKTVYLLPRKIADTVLSPSYIVRIALSK